MPGVERAISLAVPPQKVWEAFLDLDGWLAWNPHMREVRLLTEGPLAVGSRARIALKRSPLSSVWEVTKLEPGRSFVWVANLLPGLRVAFDHVVEPHDGGSRAILRVEPTGLLGVVASPVLQFIYSRNLDHSLASLKRLLEAG